MSGRWERALALACAIVALSAMPAAAQSNPNCTGFIAPPALPNGSAANHGAMASAGRAVEAWRIERETKMASCRADIDALRAQLNTMEQAYNNAGNERNGVLGAWNAEVTEFTERRRRRD